MQTAAALAERVVEIDAAARYESHAVESVRR
jgi:hypothetical protein